MNVQLPSVPDYQAAIYETLLRIERLLVDGMSTRSSTVMHAEPTSGKNADELKSASPSEAQITEQSGPPSEAEIAELLKEHW
jgi:hypothetical protein